MMSWIYIPFIEVGIKYFKTCQVISKFDSAFERPLTKSNTACQKSSQHVLAT